MEKGLSIQEHRTRWKLIADYVEADELGTAQGAMQHFGVSYATVRDACYMHRVTIIRRNSTAEPEPRIGAVTVKALTMVARLLDPALTVREIAAEFNLTTQAVYDAENRARRAGIRFPGRDRKQETKR